ncbi:transposase, MuDR, MULE transposase domain protein [Tanacetum coccineum]
MKLLGSILLEKMRCSNRIYKVKDIQHDMSVDWKIDISYKRAWGGRNIALKMMNGSHEDSFSQLPYYCYNLKLANEGTVTHIHTDADGRFEMLYVGFGFAIRSFLCYMRPLIIIDGAHLKGNYSGTNLLAVGMDGNNQIPPLATRVSQGETGESWTWFLSRLKEQIGEPPNLCIISDRHAAIILACSTAFDKAISELRAHRPEAVNKLEQAGIKKCSRAYCPSSRYNYMTSNSVESINSLTRVVRRVPITMLAEYCQDLLQRCLWAKPWFTKINLKDTYQELVYPLKDPKLWETPNDLQVVLPPIMNKRPPGRLKNKDQIRSTNEAPILASCIRINESFTGPTKKEPGSASTPKF